MRRYLSLIKFSHSIFALPFAVIGFLIATASPNAFNLEKFLLMLACMITARSAAMAFNRYIDRKYDALNPRTATREIPQGSVKPRQALVFCILSSLVFVFLTSLINPICFYLSFVALAVILGYSLSKRFTAFCHIILGLGLSLAPIGAYLVVAGRFALEPILFSLAVVTWVSGFDILYALADEDFDREQKLKSIPAWLGGKNSIRASRLLHLFSFLFIVLAGLKGGFGLLYWLGTGVYGAVLIYQHALVKPNDLSRLNLAFFTLNGFGSVAFAAFFTADFFFHL